MGVKANDKRPYEIVSFFIHDLGRAVDIDRAHAAIQRAGYPVEQSGPGDSTKVKSRDTPASLSLPAPLSFGVGENGYEKLEDIRAEIKLYNDGAVTIVIRERGRFRMKDLAATQSRPIVRVEQEELDAATWAARLFRKLLDTIAETIIAPVPDDRRDAETYTAFCLLETPEDIDGFLKNNRRELAALVIGEHEKPELHRSQVDAALSRPFSYREDDLAVFDMDRCFIIDPRRDYEDVLLIVEHANYRLLELRALDKLLDVRLDEAEADVFKKGRYSGHLKSGTPQAKFARIQALRLEALFILENLENSSKIIGDFYLCQIYDRLCEIFNTDEWKHSIERRLDILSSVYDMVKTDTTDRKMIVLEIAFIIVCVVIPVLQTWLLLLPSAH